MLRGLSRILLCHFRDYRHDLECARIEPQGKCTAEVAEFFYNLREVYFAGLPACGYKPDNELLTKYGGELTCGTDTINQIGALLVVNVLAFLKISLSCI